MNKEQEQMMQSVCDALDMMRQFAREKASRYKYYMIKQDEVATLSVLCNTIRETLRTNGIKNQLLDELYDKLCGLMSSEKYKVSEFFTDEFFPLLDSIRYELMLYITDTGKKKTIFIKYVDFYPGFEPNKHWLYKILERRYDIVFSDTPDYLFFSCFGNKFLTYDCIRIFISNEAVYSNLNLYDYAVTYSDYAVTDRLLPNRDAFEHLKYKRLADSKEDAQAILKQKNRFCNFVYTNGYADIFREELFNQVSQYKRVDSGGKFLNNIGYNVKDLLEFQSQYKFSIACENSYYKGYITEKLINALNAKTIPIYWGDPDVGKIINHNAIINCHEYPDMESIIREIERLDNDDEAYMEKLREPILLDENMIENYLAEREQFIYHIIDQSYTKAFRRNRGVRGQWYNDFICYAIGYSNEWFSPEKFYLVKKETGTVNEKDEILHNICAVNGYIKVKGFPLEENRLYILCPYGIGDTLFVASLIKSYKIYYNEQRDVYLIVKESQKMIPDWFSDIDGKIISNNLVDVLNTYCIEKQLWKCTNFIYGHFKKSIYGGLCERLDNKDPFSLYKKYIFDLPSGCSYEIPDIKDIIKESPYVIDGKDIILMPYAASVAMIPNVFWEILAEFLSENGYKVYTNVKDDTEQPVKGTVLLTGDLDMVIALCKRSHAVISLRSGICDVLAFTSTWLFVIDTDEYYYQNWNIAQLVEREGIVDMFYSEPDDAGRIVKEIAAKIFK